MPLGNTFDDPSTNLRNDLLAAGFRRPRRARSGEDRYDRIARTTIADGCSLVSAANGLKKAGDVPRASFVQSAAPT